MDCVMCGKSVAGEGNICDECLDELRQPTTSFSPVTAALKETPPVSLAQPRAQDYYLLVTKGPHVSERFYLSDDQMSIGRDPQAELFLNDRTVSRAHAVITKKEDGYCISDADSLNGTYVNGKIVESAELKEGDEIQIGTFHLLFTCHPEENGVR